MNGMLPLRGRVTMHPRIIFEDERANASESESAASGKLRVISLFTGMGGMDVGFAEEVVVRRESVDPAFVEGEHTIPGFVRLKRMPFEVVFQNDILPEAKRICEWNRWNRAYHLEDIRDILASGRPLPSAEVVIGGFPCQDFSHAGKRGGLDTMRGTLYQSFVEVVRRVQPLVFVAENVHGLLTMPGQPIQRITSDFSEVGYEVSHRLVKCEEHGVPQTRWRVVITGIRRDQPVPDWTLENRVRCPVGPYFEHLAEPDETSDPAQRVYSKAARLAKGQGQKEIRMEDFAPTIRAEHHGNIEFRRYATDTLPERRLSVREAALIQTFPPDCTLTGDKPTSAAYRPIGNAVPPLLGYLIARRVYAAISPPSLTTTAAS
jgi:DNA (cytosine-5)-methyltransferase 1